MKHFILTGLSTALLPFAGYAVQPTGSYQRSYLSAVAPSVNSLTNNAARHKQLLALATNTTTDTADIELELQQVMPVEELFIVDAALNAADKAILRRAIKPGVAWVELDGTSPGLTQLQQTLAAYSNLATVRIFSHASAGALSMGGSHIDANSLMQHPDTFTALNAALRKGGDLLFYGCELAQGAKGEQFIDIIKNNTHIDIAASNNLTGNAALGGDWDLEIHRGDINASPLEQSIALKDFTSVLETFNFTASDVTNEGGTTSANDVIVNESGASTNFSLVVNGATQGVDANTAFRQYAYLGYDGGPGTETSVTLSFTGSQTFSPASLYIINWTAGNATFTFTSNISGSVSTSSLGNGASQSVNLSALAANTSVITITANVPFKAGIDDIVLENIVAPDTTPPTSSIAVADTALRVGETSLVTITFSEAVVGFTNADLSIANGTLSAVSSADGGTTWTATLTPSASTTDPTNVITLNNPGVTDAAGNAGTGTTNSNNYAIDTAAPTATIVVADTALAINETSLVTITFSEAVTGFTNADLSIANGTLTAVSSSDGGITWTATLTPTASTTDPTNLIVLNNTGVADAAGNAGTGTTNSNNYAIDTAPPTATIVVADAALAINETSLVTFTFSEAVAGFTNADLTIANGTLSAVSSADGGITWTATFTPTASITVPTNVITLDNTGVADAAGNAGSGTTDSNNYAIDAERPTASIVVADASLTADETSLVTITFSEAVTGFNNADLTIANGTLSAVSSSNGGITWTATLTPTASITDTTNLITLNNTGVADAAGNAGTGTTDSNNYTIDTLRPSATIVVADTALAVGETSLVTITFNEAVTGFTNADLTIANGTLSAVSSSDGGITWTATFTPTASVADATNVITLNNTGVADAAGNTGTGTTDSNNYAIDTARPTASIVVADNALAIGETSLVTFTFSEAVTGFTNADLTIANGTLSAVSSGDGGITWTATFTPTASITVPTNVITLDNTGVADAAGNAGTGTTNSNNYAIDSVRPTASIVVADNALTAGETSLVTITFSETVTGFTNADLTIANGTLSAVSSSDGGTIWTATLTPTASITDATNLITLNNTGVADAAGNTGTGTTDSNNYAIDTARPTASIVVADSAIAIGETSLVTITFSEAVVGFSNTDLTIANGTLSAVSSIDGGITWTATLTPTAGVTNTNNVITLDNTGVADTAGNVGTGTTNSNNYAIDTEAPNAPSVPDLAAGSDSGSSSTDNITNVTTPTFTGTAEPNSTVTLYDTDGSTVLGTTTATGGNWSITSSALSAGSHILTVKATDAAGNESAASSGLSVTIDTTAPAKPAAPDLATVSDTGSSNSDNLTNATSLVFNGTAEDGSTVSLSSSVNNALGTATATGSSWSLTTAAVTSEGAHNITLTATDLAGNISVASDPLAITVDKTAPAIGGVAFDQASVTNANQTALSFTMIGAEVGANAQYSISSSNGGTAVTNTFAVVSAGQQITGLNVSDLADGSLTVSLTLTDAAGNSTNPATTATINKDANAPAINTVAIANGNYKAGDTLSFSLTFSEALLLSGANSDYSLAIEIGGDSRQALLSSNAAGVLTFSYTVQAGENTTATGVVIASNGVSLLNGATIKDAGNNDATLSFSGINNSAAQVDTTSPLAAVVSTPAKAVFVNAADYQISGSHTEVGLTIHLYADTNNDGIADGAILLSTTVDAFNSWSLVQPLTADSTHNYVVIAEDAAGNVSAAVDVPTITEDSIAPVAPVVTNPAEALAVNILSQLISGTHAEDGVTVELFADADNDGVADSSTVLASAEVGAVTTGNWSLTAPLTQNTANNFVVIAKDKAANVSAAVDVVTVTQDAVAPVVTVTALATADSTPALAGTVDDTTATLSLVVNGQTYTPTNNSDGSWTLADNQIAALPHGVYDVMVTATDTQGNDATDTSLDELTIDLVPPAGYSVAIEQNRIDATNQTALSFIFSSAEIGTTYSYSISDGTNTVNGNGVVTAANQQIGPINVTALAETTLQLSVILTDAVGNNGSTASDSVVKLYNATPVITGSPATTVNEDSLYSFTPVATDADANTLTFSITNKPGWASFNASTGTLTGTPTNDQLGTTTGIVISVSDGIATASLPAFAISVLNVNDAPVVTSTALTQATQGALYSYSFTASDVDVGDTLARSAMTKPGWLDFNVATGMLSGTPANSDVGSHGVTLRVTDAAGLFSEQSFNITVANINDAPTITGTPLTQVDMKTEYLFVPQAEDMDSDSLTFSISNKPAWATFDSATGQLSGTPQRADVGSTDNIIISVSDGELSASLPAFSLQVLSTNEAPTANDDSVSLPFSSDFGYMLNVLANDTDPDEDVLQISAAQTSIGTVQALNGQLSLTTPENFSGTVTLSYSVSDAEYTDYADVIVQISGSNPAAPVITVPSDVQVNATGLFTKVAVGVATASDANGNRIAVSLLNGAPLFAPGKHELYWRATDSNGLSTTSTQLLQVTPIVSLSKARTVLNNSSASFDVILNGPAAQYPVEIGYVVSGTADSSEHNLTSGTALITAGTRATVHFDVFADLADSNSKTLLITLDDQLNTGANNSTTITVTNANLAPELTLAASQQGMQRLTFAKNDGNITISANAVDANAADVVSLQWQADAALVNLSTEPALYIVDTATLAAGVYRLAVTASDNASPALSTTKELFLDIRDSVPQLTKADSNNNLIPDDIEGLGDRNANGIPDYLDPGFDCNVIPEQITNVSAFVAEGEPGICLRKGAAAVISSTGGIELNTSDQQWIEPDLQAANIGGIFDFILLDLPVAGDSYRLVLPQRQPLPQNAVYRKLTAATGWVDFVSDARNQLFSSAGEPGFCPPPGDSSWQTGLNAGHWCVQLQIEDGGPNDADGLANGSIVDPGGVAVILNGNQLPVTVADSYNLQWNQSHQLMVLANDSDPDADTLSINLASAAFGAVSISDDGQSLWYTPDNDFVGPDTLSYSVTDSNGGSASATVAITVYYNRAPVLGNSTASTDDRTAIVLNVLANASDADNDTLTISAASAQQGTVSITAEQTLRYVPKTGFAGTDVVRFSVSDGRGGEVQAEVTVSLTAYEVITVVNKSSGGAINGWPLLWLTALLALRRKILLKPLLLLTALLSLHTQANWSVDMQLGQSKARLSAADIRSQLPANASLLNVDNKGTSWALGVSYPLGERIDIQAHYVDLGSSGVTLSADTLTPAQSHQALSDIGPLSAQGVRSGLSYRAWQSDNWQLALQAGVFVWHSEQRSQAGDTLIRYKTNDTDIYWALSAGYQLSPQLSVHSNFNRYNLHGNNADNLMLGLRYQF